MEARAKVSRKMSHLFTVFELFHLFFQLLTLDANSTFIRFRRDFLCVSLRSLTLVQFTGQALKQTKKTKKTAPQLLSNYMHSLIE